MKKVMQAKVIQYEMEVNYLSRNQAEDYVYSLSDSELAQAYEDVLNNWVE